MVNWQYENTTSRISILRPCKRNPQRWNSNCRPRDKYLFEKFVSKIFELDENSISQLEKAVQTQQEKVLARINELRVLFKQNNGIFTKRTRKVSVPDHSGYRFTRSNDPDYDETYYCLGEIEVNQKEKEWLQSNI